MKRLLNFRSAYLEFCRIMIYKEHNKRFKLTLNYNYTFGDEGIEFDFSNSKGLDAIKYLRHLPMSSLNLENTSFWRQWLFSHYYLISVNIRNTNIRKMAYNTLLNTPLKEVIMTQEQYDQSDIRPGINRRTKLTVK